MEVTDGDLDEDYSRRFRSFLDSLILFLRFTTN